MNWLKGSKEKKKPTYNSVRAVHSAVPAVPSSYKHNRAKSHSHVSSISQSRSPSMNQYTISTPSRDPPLPSSHPHSDEQDAEILAMTDIFEKKQSIEQEQLNGPIRTIPAFNPGPTPVPFVPAPGKGNRRRIDTESFAQNLNEFVSTAAGDLDGIVQQLHFDEMHDDDELQHQHQQQTRPQDPGTPTIDDYSIGPNFPKSPDLASPRSGSSYAERVNLFEQHRFARKGTITKLQKELMEDEFLQTVRKQPPKPIGHTFHHKPPPKPSIAAKTTAGTTKKFKVRSQPVAPPRAESNDLSLDPASSKNKGAALDNNNNQQNAVSMGDVMYSISSPRGQSKRIAFGNSTEEKKEYFNINININHSPNNIQHFQNNNNHHHHEHHHSPKRQHYKATQSEHIPLMNKNKRLPPQPPSRKGTHTRYKSSSAVDNYLDFAAEEEQLNEWYKYLLSEHEYLVQHIMWYSLIEQEIPTILDRQQHDSHAIERTLITQMKYWIERYGVPAMVAHQEVHKLKTDLIKVNEEANTLEEESVQLTQQVFELENQVQLIQADKEAMETSMNEMETMYHSLDKQYKSKCEEVDQYHVQIEQLQETIKKLQHSVTVNNAQNHNHKESQSSISSMSVQPAISAKQSMVDLPSDQISIPSNSSMIRTMTPPPPPRKDRIINNKHRKSLTPGATPIALQQSKSSIHDIVNTVSSPRGGRMSGDRSKLTVLQSENESLQNEIKTLRQLLTHSASTPNVLGSKKSLNKPNYNINKKRRSAGKHNLQKDLKQVVQQMTQEKIEWEEQKNELLSEIQHLNQKIKSMDHNNNKRNNNGKRISSPNIRPSRPMPPPKQFSVDDKKKLNRVAIKTNVSMTENELSRLEVMSKFGDDEEMENNILVTAEIDEYENSDDGWMSEEEEKAELNTGKPVLSQSKSGIATNPGAVPPAPSRPPPKSKGLKKAKITEVVIPAHLNSQNYTYTVSGPNFESEIAATEEKSGFNGILAKFVGMDKKNSMDHSAPPPTKKMASVDTKYVIKPKKRNIPKRPPPSKALPKRTIIANVKRTKQRFFKPKKYGLITIEATNLWDNAVIANKPQFYAVIDGLPVSTNIDQHEPEWKKKKHSDLLVPFLCFFKQEKDYKDLLKSTENKSVRDIGFQKKFALFCNGIIRLSDAEIHHKMKELLKNLGVDSNEYNVSEFDDDGSKYRLHIATNVEQKENIEFHSLSFVDAKTRNQWMSTAQIMINKRRDSLQKRKTSGNTHQHPTSGKYKMRLYD